jgi:hypothetical protein
MMVAWVKSVRSLRSGASAAGDTAPRRGYGAEMTLLVAVIALCTPVTLLLIYLRWASSRHRRVEALYEAEEHPLENKRTA